MVTTRFTPNKKFMTYSIVNSIIIVFWFFLSLFNTAGAHSGYHVFAAKGHDIHHEKFKYNFGVGGMMDFLCGTRYVETKKD